MNHLTVKLRISLRYPCSFRMLTYHDKTFQTSSEFTTRISKSKLVTFHHNSKTKVGILELNSPQTYNALSLDVAKAFRQQVITIGQAMDDGELDVNCIVLQGAGKAFSSGGDLTWLRSLAQNNVVVNVDEMRKFYDSFLCMRKHITVPIVAAVQGPAFGAGAALMAACDVRIVSADAIIGFNFVKIGIHAGMGASHFLPNIIGQSLATMILLTGDDLDGKDAKRIGLASNLVDKNKDVKLEALAYAEKIASRGSVAVRTMTQSLRSAQNYGLEQALIREASAQSMCYAMSKDWNEGLDAVIKRRSPEFSSYSEGMK